VTLATFERDIVRLCIRSVVSIHHDRVLNILIPVPLIPDEIVGTMPQSADRQVIDIRRDSEVIRYRVVSEVSSHTRLNLRDSIIRRVTGISLFAHEFTKVVPQQTDRHSEVVNVCKQVIHYRDNRSLHTGENSR